MSDPQKEAQQTSAFWSDVKAAVSQVLQKNTPRIEKTGYFLGERYRAVIYTVNEVVPVRIDLKTEPLSEKEGG